MFKRMKQYAANEALLTLCEDLSLMTREATDKFISTGNEVDYARARALLDVRHIIVDRVKE